jgi:outer membrane immunogenic protein
MKKCTLGLLGLTLTSIVAIASANAADMYRGEPAGGYKDGPVFAPVTTWTGFYAGVNGGYAWSQDSNQFADQVYHFGGIRPEGGFGGGQIGYNWQGVWHPHMVLGVEADIQGADINDAKAGPLVFGAHLNAESKVDWFGTVRGRLGYAFDRTLVYFTGGLAYGSVDNKTFFTPCCARYVNTGTETGYVLGGGLEYKIAPAWSVKAEYQYLNFGNNDPARITDGRKFGSFAGNTVNDDAFHTVRVGLNYHVGQSYEPLK